jgi:hypothetical protein
MRAVILLQILFSLAAWSGALLVAQMPFYTDNPDVTDRGTLHFEFLDEFDGLQSAQFPDLRQNTFNCKANYGLPYGLELNFDAPYLSVYRAPISQTSHGLGDLDAGIKWNFRKASGPLSSPSLAASLYLVFPTGDTSQSLGSGGITDYWLNAIAGEPLTGKTRLNANFGFLFSSTSSTDALGVQTINRGHVYTGGLSLLHDFTPRLTLGVEAFGAVADNKALSRDQLQGLGGGWFQLNRRMAITFALLGRQPHCQPYNRWTGRIRGRFSGSPCLHPAASRTNICILESPTTCELEVLQSPNRLGQLSTPVLWLRQDAEVPGSCSMSQDRHGD